MPKTLPLSAAQRKKVFRAYAESKGPADASMTLRAAGIHLSSKQVGNMAVREGWTQKKAEIADVREKSTQDVLESLRSTMSADLESILRGVMDDLKADAAKLKNGQWDLAVDSSGLSAEQRAKKLFVDRIWQLARLDPKADEGTGRANVFNMLFARPIGGSDNGPPVHANEAIEITGPAVDDEEQRDRLEFAS